MGLFYSAIMWPYYTSAVWGFLRRVIDKKKLNSFFTKNRQVTPSSSAGIQRVGQGARAPSENSEKYRVLSNTGQDPLKITKLPSQLSMLGQNSDSMAALT